MAKDEGWVDDDTTVPTGWRTKEYVNKGNILNFISVFYILKKKLKFINHIEK